MSILQEQVNTGENENVSLLSVMNLLLQNFVCIRLRYILFTDTGIMSGYTVRYYLQPLVSIGETSSIISN